MTSGEFALAGIISRLANMDRGKAWARAKSTSTLQCGMTSASPLICTELFPLVFIQSLFSIHESALFSACVLLFPPVLASLPKLFRRVSITDIVLSWWPHCGHVKDRASIPSLTTNISRRKKNLSNMSPAVCYKTTAQREPMHLTTGFILSGKAEHRTMHADSDTSQGQHHEQQE